MRRRGRIEDGPFRIVSRPVSVFAASVLVLGVALAWVPWRALAGAWREAGEAAWETWDTLRRVWG